MSRPTAKVRYAAGGPSLEISMVYAWNRGDIDAPVMSSSSGPKDYIKNQIWSVFNQRPEVTRVVMVRGGGPPFLLMRTRDNYWFDVTGEQVVNV